MHVWCIRRGSRHMNHEAEESLQENVSVICMLTENALSKSCFLKGTPREFDVSIISSDFPHTELCMYIYRK